MSSDRWRLRPLRDLTVWRKEHVFVLAVYRYTDGESLASWRDALAHQMRRAAASIPTNIAEGFGKRNSADKPRFLNIAERSLEESRYYLILAHDLGYGDSGA